MSTLNGTAAPAVRVGTVQAELVLDGPNYGLLTLAYEPGANADGTGEMSYVFRDTNNRPGPSGVYDFTPKTDGELARLFAPPGEKVNLEWVVPVAQSIRAAADRLVKASQSNAAA